MEDTPSYILPSDSEKTSSKFLLDRIKLRRRTEDIPVEEISPTVEPETPAEVEIAAACGTQADEPLYEEQPPHESIPFQELSLPDDKQYFRIGEVSELIGVEAHVLRYWESEFSLIRPSKSGGQRVYRRKDVENLALIRHLLHIEKFSIKGARKKLYEKRQKLPISVETAAPKNDTVLRELAHELRDLIRLAQGNPGF